MMMVVVVTMRMVMITMIMATTVIEVTVCDNDYDEMMTIVTWTL
jgi:hypothetical protein